MTRTPKKSQLGITLSDLVSGILSQPTAPFRETWVKRACLSYCHDLKLPAFEDEIGNLWLNARNSTEARKASLVFVAHLDHPGIVITKFRQLAGKIFAYGDWLGGGPMDIRNFEVKVFSDVNALMVFDGVIRKHTSGPRGAKQVCIEIKSSPLARAACTPEGLEALGPWGACLWYGRHQVPAGVELKKKLWVTKAADDLVGVSALIEGLRRARRPRGVVALLTRAEESGFHGTLHVLEKRVLNPRNTLMISIETSSQLPGATLGNGPVVRLGDRATIFDPAFVYWIEARAAELAKKYPSFRYQRRVMDGGTCEATAFNCYGFRVAGISTPLRNYHNLSPSGRPLPEAVAASDVEHLAALIAHLMKTHRRAHAHEIKRLAFARYIERLLQNQREHERYFEGF